MLEELNTSLDFQKIMEVIGKILFYCIRIPLKYWNLVPIYFKIPIYTVIILICGLIIFYLYKNKEEIMFY